MKPLAFHLYCLAFLAVSCSKEDNVKPTQGNLKPPVITNISPSSGQKGDVVTITGLNFGVDTATFSVSFNNIKSSITFISDTQLKVIVPAKAGTGAITIALKGSIVTGPLFTYHITTTVTTLAGDGTAGNNDAIGTAATFHTPLHLCTDSNGNIYVVDHGNLSIRKITPGGTVTTFASGFDSPNGIAADASDHIYVTDGCKVKMITPGGLVSTIAGTQSYSCGYQDGTPSQAMFSYPYGICANKKSEIFVAERGNHAVRQIAGNISTLAGGNYGDENGLATSAKFRYPHAVAANKAGEIFVLDQSNYKIKKVSGGTVSTFAGSAPGHTDAIGSASKLNSTNAICMDDADKIYFMEITGISATDSSYLRTITPDGNVQTLFGNIVGYQDGDETTSRFPPVYGITVSHDGIIYCATEDNRIRKIVIE